MTECFFAILFFVFIFLKRAIVFFFKLLFVIVTLFGDLLLGSYITQGFWIQNSRLFPDFFPKHEFIFPDSRLSMQIGDQKRPEKSQEQSFFHDALQTYGRD